MCYTSLVKLWKRGMTMAQMTKMQQRIYDYIAETIQRQGYPPSVREIGEAVGLKSPSTVHFHLKHMEELGVLNDRVKLMTQAEYDRLYANTQSDEKEFEAWATEEM